VALSPRPLFNFQKEKIMQSVFSIANHLKETNDLRAERAKTVMVLFERLGYWTNGIFRIMNSHTTGFSGCLNTKKKVARQAMERKTEAVAELFH
jgi:hypothetical protein